MRVVTPTSDVLNLLLGKFWQSRSPVAFLAALFSNIFLHNFRVVSFLTVYWICKPAELKYDKIWKLNCMYIHTYTHIQIKSTKTSYMLRKLLAYNLGLSFFNLGISNILILKFLILIKSKRSVQQDGLTCLQKSQCRLLRQCVCVCL